MGTATNQIESHIEETRDNLGSNFDELEQKVKSMTDWKEVFRNYPMTVMGVAFGGGVLIAGMLGKGRRHWYREQANGATHTAHIVSDRQKAKALEIWDNIKGALIGLAATRVKNYVGELVPGFNEQYHRAQQGKTPNAAA